MDGSAKYSPSTPAAKDFEPISPVIAQLLSNVHDRALAIRSTLAEFSSTMLGLPMSDAPDQEVARIEGVLPQWVEDIQSILRVLDNIQVMQNDLVRRI